MRQHFLIKHLACLVTLMAISINLWAGRLYQYEDESGRTVLDDRVPKAVMHKGYKVLNDRGYVVEVVPPALTEAQKQVLREEEQRQKALKKLLKTYSEPADAELARDRQLEMLDNQISVKKGEIARLSSLKKRETEKAASLERAGRKVHAAIEDKINRLDREIAAAEVDIVKREQEKEEARARFEKDIQQLRKLMNMPAKTPKN